VLARELHRNSGAAGMFLPPFTAYHHDRIAAIGDAATQTLETI
jgi:hypothetical protein